MLNRKNLNLALSFLAVMFVATVASAQEATHAASAEGLGGNVKVALAIAAGLGMAIASFGGAMGQGKAVAAALEGIARNPGSQPKVFIPMLVGLALVESLVILAFVVCSGLAGKI